MSPLVHRGEYPSDWVERSTRVRQAAGWRCIRCGHPAGDTRLRRDEGAWCVALVECDANCAHPDDGKMRVLTVHHLDGDKSNVQWWNLLALCQVCHLVVQAKVMPDRPYLFEHTPWFRPYVAGFYAWYYGRVALTREQVEADLARWLRAGQPWLTYTDLTTDTSPEVPR